MKRLVNVIAVTFIVVMSGFLLSINSEASMSEENGLSSPHTTIAIEVPPKTLNRYSETETAKVSSKLDSLLKRINKRHDFHGAILVAKKGKIVYDSHIGYADFGKKKKLTDKDVFQLASVSKQFTAAAILLLKERNALKLSDTIQDYFPGFPYEDVTIKNLLNHTAGLPKYFWLAEHKWEEQKAPTNEEMMDLLEVSQVQRFFKPGRNFDYSNTGYMVLASVVEKISGMSFGDFLKRNIFDPLDMNDSFVYSFENDKIRENQLIGYRLYRGWRHLKINGTVNDAIVGDKNVYATSEDLIKWVIGLNDGSIFSKESVDLMYTKGETIYGRKVPYGLGFRIDTKDRNAIYHYGKWNGFSTGLTQYLDEDLVVIVLEHTSYNAMKSLNNKIKHIVNQNFDA